jgi:general secretion pathway protein D
MFHPTRWCAHAVAALAIALAGCASQQAYRDGQDLDNAGRAADALARYEEAARLEPRSAQYRVAVLRTRERLLVAAVERGDALRRLDRLDEAEKAFREALAVQPGHEKAQAGLRAIDTQRRAAQWMGEAQAALARKDIALARTRLHSVLLEQPGHPAARAQLQRLEDEAARPPPEAALASAYRKPITIEFKDAALRSVFEVISRTSGLNFLFDKDVRADQKTSIFLKNSTIERAVQLTLLTNQLEQRVLDANTVLIYPNTPAKQKDYQPLTVKSFYLANADAKVVAATLKALLKTRDVVVDEKLNLLIVRDSPQALRLAQKLVALHDMAEPEVMLEVEVLEVKRTRLLDLGVRWPDQLSLAPLPATGGVLTLADLRNLNSASLAATVGPVTISARKNDSDTNILANPRIRARNREKARILIGERVPNITTTSTSTGFVAESVTYVDVGLKLEVEPTIYLDGEVAIRISLEVSNIIREVQTKSGTVAYQIGTRNAQTVLRLRDGENQVLAGLINDEDRRSANKVPGLGEVPVVGRLFGGQTEDGVKTEIVLSLTPRIVRNLQRPAGSVAEFESGTENSLGVRPIAGAPSVAESVAAPAVAANVARLPVAPAAPTAGGAQLRWQGPSQVKAGDLVAVQLLVQADQPIASLPLAVRFDPRVLQPTAVTEGDFMRQHGASASFASRIDPSGQILITGTRAGDTGAEAPGVFATLNFRVAAGAADTTRLDLVTVSPVAVGGRPLTSAPPAPFVFRVVP